MELGIAVSMEKLFEEKRQIVRKSGLLELVPQDVNFDHLGGFGNLKKWLELQGLL